jgi:hypothetical protein
MIQDRGGSCVTPPLQSHISMTNNNQNKYKILCAGIDTLDLSIYVTWRDNKIFDQLETLKKEAQRINEAIGIDLGNEESEEQWLFMLQKNTFRGHEYCLIAKYYSLRISPKQNLGTMPNVFVEIRAEALWTFGEEEAVNKIIILLKQYTISINLIKPSRFDICLDIELPKDEWSQDILDNAITKAKVDYAYRRNKEIETMYVGEGDLLARIYNKAVEIKIHNKEWMYAIWNIDKSRNGTRIIRVEFQLRRPVIKSLGINTIEDLYREKKSVWAYLSQNWLKFLVKEERNKERQKIFPWWIAVQNGFGEGNEPSTRVRHESIRMEKEQIAKRVLTFLENHQASVVADRKLSMESVWTLDNCYEEFKWTIRKMGIDDNEISNNIMKKVHKFQRQDNEKVPF